MASSYVRSSRSTNIFPPSYAFCQVSCFALKFSFTLSPFRANLNTQERCKSDSTGERNFLLPEEIARSTLAGVPARCPAIVASEKPPGDSLRSSARFLLSLSHSAHAEGGGDSPSLFHSLSYPCVGRNLRLGFYRIPRAAVRATPGHGSRSSSLLVGRRAGGG